MDLPFWAWGLAGGAAAELLRWFRIRDQLHNRTPDWAKSWLYWVVTSIMVVFGALLVLMYQGSDGVQLSPVLAFNIGASAPLILSSLTSQVPPLTQVD